MHKKERKARRDAEKRRLSPLARDIINFWETSMELDITDTLGSYTGRPADDDVPEQDPDDL